mgnify:CR=1 FL=1
MAVIERTERVMEQEMAMLKGRSKGSDERGYDAIPLSLSRGFLASLKASYE